MKQFKVALHRRWGFLLVGVLALLLMGLAGASVLLNVGSAIAQAEGEGDPEILKLMKQINDQLAEQGLNVRIEEIELFTIGPGRPSTRIHQQPFRWVAGDPRRAAQGDDITYLVDQSEGATASGLSNAATEAAIDRSMTTWDGARCLQKVSLVKRTDSGVDPDIFDSFFPPFPPMGNPFLCMHCHVGAQQRGE